MNKKNFDFFTKPISLGCWALGNTQWGGQNISTSKRTIRKAVEIGINHFDTAESYGNGLSEQLLGQTIEKNRTDISVATKSMFRPGRNIRSRLERSLKRLNREYIDIYYLHWPLGDYDLRPMMEDLEKERLRGTIRFIGISNCSVSQLNLLQTVGRIDILQYGYNLLWRRPEQEIIPWACANNIPLVPYSPMAQGILFGKFTKNPEFHPQDNRPKTLPFQKAYWPEVLAAVGALQNHAHEIGFTLPQLAAVWLLKKEFIPTIIVGARTPNQLDWIKTSNIDNLIGTKSKTVENIERNFWGTWNRLNDIYPKSDNYFGHV